MIEIANRHITSPAYVNGDGIGIEGELFSIHDCIIDLSGWDISDIDEALGLTNGADGIVSRCVIRGAGKLVLVGSGDSTCNGRTISFTDCIFENCGRRMPEVQDGYIVHLKRCLIQNWGIIGRFDTRAFGAWAHDGGDIYARNCIFRNLPVYLGIPCWDVIERWMDDKIGHIGQAINEEGFKALLKRKTWLSGFKRALTAGPDGYVKATDCWWGDGLVVENAIGRMSDSEAQQLLDDLEQMRADLKKQLGVN